MKSAHRRLVYLALLLVCFFCAASQVRTLRDRTSAASLKPADTETQARVNEGYGKLPLSFEVNRGQADAPIRFLSTGGNYSIHLRPNEVALNLNGAESSKKRESSVLSPQTAQTP